MILKKENVKFASLDTPIMAWIYEYNGSVVKTKI